MRPFLSSDLNFSPQERSNENSVSQGSEFQPYVSGAAAQGVFVPYSAARSALSFAPENGWMPAEASSSYTPQYGYAGAALFAENAGNSFVLPHAYQHADGSGFEAERNAFDFSAAMPSAAQSIEHGLQPLLLPHEVKMAITARLATAPVDQPDILRTIADDVLADTGFLVSEEDVQRQLNDNRIEAQAVLNERNAVPKLPPQLLSATGREYIPEGGGPGIRKDAEGRVSTTEIGILPSELPALLAPYKDMPIHDQVADPEKTGQTIRVTLLRARYSQRVLVPDPQDNTKLIRRGTLKARKNDRKMVVDDADGSKQVTKSALRQRRLAHKKVADPQDQNKTINTSTLKYRESVQRLEEAQRHPEQYPIGHIAEDGTRNFKYYDIVRDPENPQKVMYGGRLTQRFRGNMLMIDNEKGDLVTRNVVNHRRSRW